MSRLTIALLVVLATVAVPGRVMARSTCFGVVATITGRGTITGTPNDDVIVGSKEDDEIDGMGGNDLICGFDDNDRLESETQRVQPGVVVWFDGGDGYDTVVGPEWARETHLFGGNGPDDVIDSSFHLAAQVELDGGEGDDLIATAWQVEADATTIEISGGPGNDEIHYHVESESVSSAATLHISIDGGDGNDEISPFNPSSTLSPSFSAFVVATGGTGGDLIRGASLGTTGASVTTIENTLRGDEGDDELFAGSGVTITNGLDGGPDTDVCHGGAGSSDSFRRCEQIV